MNTPHNKSLRTIFDIRRSIKRYLLLYSNSIHSNAAKTSLLQESRSNMPEISDYVSRLQFQSMQTVILTRGKRALTLGQDGSLPRYIVQNTKNFFVAVDESIDGIRNVHVVAEFLDQFLRSAQIVSGDAGVQVVNGLELETAVEEIQPLGTIHIHSCSQHLLRERLVDA